MRSSRIITLTIIVLFAAALLMGCSATEIPEVPEVAPTPEPTPEPTPQPVIEHSITLNLNYEDAEELPAFIVEDGATISDVPTFEREGFLFLHWSPTADGEDELSEDKVFVEDMALYAQWERELSEQALALIDEGYLMVKNTTGIWIHAGVFSDPHYIFVTERGAELIEDGFVFIPLPFNESPYETSGIFVTEMAAISMLIGTSWYYKDNPDDMYCTLGVIVSSSSFKIPLERGGVLAFRGNQTIEHFRYNQYGAYVGTAAQGNEWIHGETWRPQSDPIIINHPQ